MYKLLFRVLICTCLIFPPNASLSAAEPVKHEKGIIGMALLALLQPKFPVARAIKVLKASPKPGISFVYGAFGKDPTNFHKIMSEVPETDVLIYGLCGPCRVPRRNGKMEHFHRELTINALNRKLVNNESIRNDLKDYFTIIKRDFVDPYPETKFEFATELESGFNAAAETIALNIAQEVFYDSPNVTFRTNPLNFHRYGNLPVETHTVDPKRLKKLRENDSVSLDGLLLTLEETKVALDYCRKKRIDFYLWYPEWQGNLKPGMQTIPEKRVYKISNYKELIKLIRSK